MTTSLDLSFRIGDPVRRRGDWPRSRAGVISDISLDTAEVSGIVMPLTDLQFTCHNHGAPFETTVLDEDGMYQDGYDGGYEWAVKGSIYQAGGPYVSTAGLNDCRHQKQYREFQLKNNKAFRKGWAQGQKDALMTEHRTIYITLPGGTEYATLRGASDSARNIENAIIITQDQKRTGTKSAWETIKIGGPVTPLPPLVTQYIEFNEHGVPDGLYRTKHSNKDRQAVKLIRDGDRIVSVELVG